MQRTENRGSEMMPLYAARIEDLGPGDFVKVDCAACCRRLLRSSAGTPSLAYGAAFLGVPVAARPQPTGLRCSISKTAFGVEAVAHEVVPWYR
jgi:hypothetical protein